MDSFLPPGSRSQPDGIDIELRAVTHGYSGSHSPVLAELNLSIPAGDYLVIIGRSGSGKSTLLNLIGALDLPVSGQVLRNGQDLATLGEAGRALYRRRDVGFVFQAFNLLPALTVMENLRVPAQLAGLRSAQALARCGGLLEQAGLSALADRFPDELSGGEQQRIAVLRAVVHEPPIVIADEPTGNLDLETARQTLDLLELHAQAPGRSLIMATHSAEVMGRARRVLSIRAGHVEAAVQESGGPCT